MAKSRWEIENQASRRQEPLRLRAYLPPRAHSLLRLVAHLLGSDHRTALPVVTSIAASTRARRHRPAPPLQLSLERRSAAADSS